ncbi:replication initiator protein [Microviridae sp.]|nr:replication initiator protein [Microviridae sp.]
MKNLRYHTGAKVKYVMCGEYGAKGTIRPHYHACLFGYDFKDKEYHSTNRFGDTLYKSSELLSYWKKGHVTVGDLNFKSAKYVGRYCTKKITGEKAKLHYKRSIEGRDIMLRPEYLFASNGIGLQWLNKFRKDIYDGYVVLDNKKLPIPRYYKKKLEEHFPNDFERLRESAIDRGMSKNDAMIQKGESPLATAHQAGKFLEIINAECGKRSYENA